MGFVYDGQGALAGRVFITTAGHCYDDVGVGYRVADSGGDVFGTVVAIGANLTEEAANDYLLIEVDRSQAGRVDPAVAGHPETPSGVLMRVSETAPLDLLQFSGWGVGFDASDAARQGRQGPLTDFWSHSHWVGVGAVSNGDSGSPVVHVNTGKAVGHVVGFTAGTQNGVWGPTARGVTERLAEIGFPVRMRLAGEKAPPPPPPPPPTSSGQQGPQAAPSPSPASEPKPKSKTSKPKPKSKGSKRCRAVKKKSRRSKRVTRCRRQRHR